MSEQRSFAERNDVSGAAVIVVGALSLALLIVVVALAFDAGSAAAVLADLADKLVTGLLAMLAATRLSSRTSGPPPAEGDPTTVTASPGSTVQVTPAQAEEEPVDPAEPDPELVDEEPTSRRRRPRSVADGV